MVEPPLHLFLSYASGDHARVLPVATALERAGVAVWLDRAGIPGGANYGPEIVAAIRGSGALAVCCSPAAFLSRNVRQEVALAWKQERPILPLLLESAEIPDDLAYWLEAAQWVEVLGRAEGEWLPEVLRSLKRLGLVFDPPSRAANTVAGVAGSVRLPTPLTAILGRDAEVREIADLLVGHRLVTLTGSGGVGKTRLAIEAARTAAPTFPDGLSFVDLSALRDPDLVVPTVAQTLGVQESPGIRLGDALAASIGDRRLLLVLDNVEHVIEAAPEIATLLAACSGLAVLATSRASLAVRGEHPYPVAPLPVPAESGALALEEITSYPAVALFAERAATARPGFAVTAENAADIVEICVLLDGLPLAVELAASRIRLLPPDALLAKLGTRLPLLTGGARDLPIRQRTLRDAIAWSHDLLPPAEQTVFRRLAVFVGGCTLEAAEAVCDLDGTLSLLDAVGSLVDKSLLRQEQAAQDGPELRFRMLETVREFGVEQLRESGEEDALRGTHAVYFLEAAQRARDTLSGRLQQSVLKRLDADLANLRAAFDWSAEFAPPDAALRLFGALSLYWFWRSRFREGLEWAERALARSDGASQETVLRAMYGAGLLAHHGGAYDKLRDVAEAMWAMATAVDDQTYLAAAHVLLSFAARNDGDRTAAAEHAEAALAGARATGNVEIVGATLMRLGAELAGAGNLVRAEEIHREALEFFDTHGNVCEMAVELANLGDISFDRGDLADAADRHHRALEVFRDVGVPWMVVETMLGLAEVASSSGQPEQATRLLGAAETARRRVGLVTYGRTAERQPVRVAALRKALGETAFAAAWEAGASLPLEDAVAEALAVRART